MNQEPHSPIDRAATVDHFVDTAQGEPRLEVLGLHGSAGACALAELLRRDRRRLAVVTADAAAARRLALDLEFYLGEPEAVAHLPAWELFPFEPLSPHPDIEARRIAALHAFAGGRAQALVLPVQALQQRVVPRSMLRQLQQWLRVGAEVEREALLQQLVALGYHHVPLVEDRGTFAVRGDLVDLFPSTLEMPVRIEFFGDSVDRIRPFDPASQRSQGDGMKEVAVLPARELLTTGAQAEVFSRRLRELCDRLEQPRTVRDAILEELREGIVAPGRCFLLPLCFEGLDSLFDYAGDARWVVVDPPAVERAADAFHDEVEEGHRRQLERGEPVVPVESLYLSPAALTQEWSRRPRLELASLELYRLEEDRRCLRFRTEGNADLHLDRHDGAGLAPLVERLRQWQHERWSVLLVCHQEGQARRLLDLLAPHGLQPAFRRDDTDPTVAPGALKLVLGELSAGFRLPEEGRAVITEEEIFGGRRRRSEGRARMQALLSSLAELKEGDYVVHADHGVGRYRGLLHLRLRDVEGDFLHLEYADGDKLYLPVERIEKVAKYQGAEGYAPRLDKMGGGAWEKAKLKARAAVEELARELLRLYAKRELHQGFAYSAPDRLYREFEAAFPFEETPDQLQAIDEVLADMQSARPMDRLVCGDVGYGKTEVAIRAAMKAVLDGKQVAVLVPTTILADQHWLTFGKRLEGFPVTVGMVSRFRTAAENRQTLERAAAGRLDILIGTHRLLQRDVRFKDLGLLVIDEEQRFGVAHKERLKAFRAEVDVLTLTATPIPRTLHMGLAGLRDLSVIDTPPVDRLAVRTYVTRFEDDLVRQAILRELRRGGQVFFVHNRVQTIAAMAEQVRALVPEATVAVGHGQMAEKELERVMLDFMDGKTQILVSSAIIENGLDIPRANTLIVNRADCFGLSQLYQLRGRVGRSNIRAYAYLLIPGEAGLTAEARERLRVLQELTELGAGFRIASHDLELRGAGDLLGGRQSGQIAAVGFEMYTELLQETIAELRGQELEERIDPELRLGLSAFLPEAYLPDPNQRLVFYQKLAAAADEAALYATVDELADRCGPLPEAAQLLVETMGLRVLMKRLRIELADYDGHVLTFAFHASTPASPDVIRQLMTDPTGRYRFTPDYRLAIRIGRVPAAELPEAAKKELHRFF